MYPFMFFNNLLYCDKIKHFILPWPVHQLLPSLLIVGIRMVLFCWRCEEMGKGKEEYVLIETRILCQDVTQRIEGEQERCKPD